MYPEIKRRDLGIAGTLIVLFQSFISFQSSQNISAQFEKLEQQIQDSKVHTEQFFVRKEEMDNVSKKLEKMNDQLTRLNNKVISLRSFLKDRFKYGDESSEISCEAAPLKVAGMRRL